jgi:hypothetical protein
MGFLDNTTITVDAILTKKGRQKLAQNGKFDVKFYAFADDEIDYGLYDVSHPQGSSYYGAVLENMPVLEAFTDETQVMRYKLFTAAKDITKLATIFGLNAIETISLNAPKTITPQTDGFNDDVYDFQILNVDVVDITGPNGESGTFARDGRSKLIKNVKTITLNAKDRTGLTNPIIKTVLFVTSTNTGATTSIIIQNNSTGQF